MRAEELIAFILAEHIATSIPDKLFKGALKTLLEKFTVYTGAEVLKPEELRKEIEKKTEIIKKLHK